MHNRASATVSQLVKAEPRMLVYNGELLCGAMHDERVVEVEVLAAVRQQGMATLDAVEAVVLETDSTLHGGEAYRCRRFVGMGGCDRLRTARGLGRSDGRTCREGTTPTRALVALGTHQPRLKCAKTPSHAARCAMRPRDNSRE